MPTYVYSCSACDKIFEADQRITEDPLDTCECGSKGTVKRVIQPVGISFKGSGFHINDYSSSSSAPKESPSESKSETPAETKTEATPAPTPPPAPSTSSE